MARNPIVFNNGTLVSNAKVEIGGTIYDVEPAQYEGTTPLSANNLNQLQTNLYDYVDEKEAEAETYIDNKILSKPNGLSYPISGDKDLNNIVKNGFYYGNDLVNSPSNLRYGYLLVIAHNSLANYCTQIFVPMLNNNTYLYFRNLYNGTWTSWMRLTGTAVS